MQEVRNKLVDIETGDEFYYSDCLEDVKNGKKVKWKEYKLQTQKLADVFLRISDLQENEQDDIYYKRRYLRCLDCANILVFRHYLKTKELKLERAYFCKLRLCPMCSFRRSLKVFGQVSKVMDYMIKNTDYEYIFLTLTAKNVYGNELESELDKYFNGFNLLTKRKEFKAISKGFFRALEITRNWEMNEYHPHFHVIIAVDKSYFTNTGYYISQKRWRELWQSCMGLSYDPYIDIRKIKPNINIKTDGEVFINYSKAIAEVAKYTVKSSDVIFELSGKTKRQIGKKAVEQIQKAYEPLTDETVVTLDKALHHRRLVAFAGELKIAHKLLNLDDTIDGDLVNTDNEEKTDDKAEYFIAYYFWSFMLGNYFKIGHQD